MVLLEGITMATWSPLSTGNYTVIDFLLLLRRAGGFTDPNPLYSGGMSWFISFFVSTCVLVHLLGIFTRAGTFVMVWMLGVGISWRVMSFIHAYVLMLLHKM